MTPAAYTKNAVRTKSDQFFDVLVPPAIMQVAVTEAMVTSNLMDAVKKALFYGRPYQSPQRLINAAGAMPSSIAEKGFNFNAVPKDVLHAILGVFTEAGEMVEALGVTAIDGEPLDEVNLDEEFGDVLWYIAVYCNARGISMESLMTKNITKLRARFPDRFTTAKANERDLFTERAILEADAEAEVEEGADE
jgi:NTP pyrophosphatase (non-canonical NTP hydrolase)